MKKIIVSSITFALVSSFFLIALGVAVDGPGRADFGGVAIMYAIITAIIFVGLIALRSALSYHKQMTHKGWQRILTIASVIVVGLCIWIVYEVEYIRGFEHLFTIVGGAVVGYCLTILGYIAITTLTGWISGGFKESE